MSDNQLTLTGEREIQATPAVNAESLLAKAIESGIGVEQMERLMQMRRELKEEYARERYFLALSDFQNDMPPVAKSKAVMNKDGKTVRYNYAPLDEIIKTARPVLHKHGFSYSVDIVPGDGNIVSVVAKLHHIEGHTETATFSVPVDPSAYMSAPQQYASAQTFAKRYAFCAVTGIMTADEDDDANLTFSDGIAYADQIRQLDAITDLEELRKTGHELYSQLKDAKDNHGAQIVLSYYNQRKAELGG